MEGGRKRPLRATSRPPSEFTASANAANGGGSSDDEDYEGGHQVGYADPTSSSYWVPLLKTDVRRRPLRLCHSERPAEDNPKLTSRSWRCASCANGIVLALPSRPVLRVMSCHLQTISLKKYRKLHDMDDLPPGASREDMIPAVAKHFSQQVVFCKVSIVAGGS